MVDIEMLPLLKERATLCTLDELNDISLVKLLVLY